MGNNNAEKNNVAETSTLNRTAERIAEQHKVSERTIRDDAHYAEAVDIIIKD